jgi:hypothetical protein
VGTAPGRRRPAQRARQQLAEEAIRDGGPLPGDPQGRLVALDIPYKTHLRKGYELWPEPEFIERTAAAHDAACKRTGIAGVGHLITFYSNDGVVTISNHALLGALREVGLTARWLF